MSKVISPHGEQHSYADAVASNVRAEAGRRRLSQAALSRMTGISSGTLSRKWLGTYPFDVTELEQLADAMDLPIGALLAPRPEGGYRPTNAWKWTVSADQAA